MIFKCTESFETREDGYPIAIEKDSVWVASYHSPAHGGYELAFMEEINDDGGFTGTQATIRMYRLSTSFVLIPADECKVPIGCSEFHGQ